MKNEKEKLYSFYFSNPSEGIIERKLLNVKLRYFYFDNQLIVQTGPREIINGCLLLGNCKAEFEEYTYQLGKFDIFFLPPMKSMKIKVKESNMSKICLMHSFIETEIKAKFELKKFDLDNFLPRGLHSSSNLMSTFRTVWTAIKNGYFMSGFTNVPQRSLKEGTITSVNLEKNPDGRDEIYAHIHPDYPEVYIACVDDEKYAMTQYLINQEGDSVSRDLTDGEGVFFPGEYGHSNFTRPTYKNLKYCMYLWMIPTFGKSTTVDPITLK
ncbi:MAG: hypothetical protein EU532_13615 [Promethearchaeota archaeon]|nr:MAG: hypothetical protein EU532_13615 [Candidatus Lokiarchaeota archaeon]